MTPTNQVKEILLAASRHGARLFRRNVGFGWIAGPHQTFKADRRTSVVMEKDDVLLRQPRPFNNGIKGQADIYGWVTITITSAMVGQKIAVHVEAEAKQGSGRATAEQKAWIEAVQAAGGRAGIVRSVEDAIALLEPPNNLI